MTLAPPTFRQRFRSTRDAAVSPVSLSLAEAVLAGAAPGGGLLVPETLEPFTTEEVDALAELDLVELSTEVGARLLGADLSREELRSLLADALDFPVPLVPLPSPRDDGQELRVLELFHGPTLAFKDVGARCMARLLSWARRRVTPDARDLTILVATSGDTGSAVARAFLGLEGFRVVVLFPEGKISEAQRRLFTTLGGNTRSLAVEGTFDDCQRLVKEAFADQELRDRVPLGSANSINVARLLPQCFYHFWIRNNLSPRERRLPLRICVPSGNFGNLTAGLLAQRLGLPVERFVAATNVNDVVPAFLAGGELVPRPSTATVANAMDVGDPSNFERMRWLFEGDDDTLRDAVDGARFEDERVLEAIGEVAGRTGVLLDPHSAIGHLALTEGPAAEAMAGPRVDVFLATAHPGKFADVVERATGREVALPGPLAQALERDEGVETLPPEAGALRRALTDS